MEIIQKDTQIRIFELLEKCPYEKIEEKILLHYGSYKLEQYKNLYIELKDKALNTII